MNKLFISAVALFVAYGLYLSWPKSADAKPILLSCNIQDSSHPGYRSVHSIEIDVQNNSMDLRNNTGNWLWKNRNEFGRETFNIEVFPSMIVGYGVRAGQPSMMQYKSDGTFIFVTFYEDTYWWYRWKCSRIQ